MKLQSVLWAVDKMKVLSLFDGISCGRVALERAGIPVEKYHAFEIDKYAIQVSQKNYPDIVHHGDVFDGDFTEFKGYDLLIGGSPCTFWSIAKSNRETTPDGIGGQLFMQYVRALKESGCKYFLYENNYSIHKNIKEYISEQLGVQPIMINSALVSAQQRKRCYWTNIPNITQPEDRNIMLKDILESGVSWQDKSYCMTASYDGAVFWNTLQRSQRSMVAEPICVNSQSGNATDPMLKQPSVSDRIYDINGKNPALTSGFKNNIAVPVGAAMRGRYIESGKRNVKCSGGTVQAIELRNDGKSNCLTTVQKDSMVAEPIPFNTFNGDGEKSRTFMAGYYKYGEATLIKNKGFKGGATAVAQPIRLGEYGKGGQGQRIYSVRGKSVTLSANGGGQGAKTGLYKIDLPDGDYIIRKLTPIEAERLQTLPDNYTEGISNTQRYKCIGNGWTVDVIAHILKSIYE